MVKHTCSKKKRQRNQLSEEKGHCVDFFIFEGAKLAVRFIMKNQNLQKIKLCDFYEAQKQLSSSKLSSISCSQPANLQSFVPSTISSAMVSCTPIRQENSPASSTETSFTIKECRRPLRLMTNLDLSSTISLPLCNQATSAVSTSVSHSKTTSLEPSSIFTSLRVCEMVGMCSIKEEVK